MGIYKRIKDIATADINDALDKMEDPIIMLKQYLRELQNDMDKAHNALAKQLYIENKYENLIEETVQTIVKRNRQTELAVDKNEDEIAKLAIQDRIKQEDKLKTYQQQFETIQSQTKLLCEQLENLKENYDELQNRKLVLISRANVAKVSSEIGRMMVTNTPERAAKGFARMEDHILQLEAKAKANMFTGKAQNTVSLNKLDTVFNDEVEKELERVKMTKVETLQ